MGFFTSADLNPKRKFRWIVEIASGTELFKVAAKTVQKPNYTLEATQHKFLNHQFNFPNRVIWQPIDITFVDHEGSGEDSVTSRLYRLLEQTGYQIPKSSANCQISPTKGKAVTGLGKVNIIQLSGDGAAGGFGGGFAPPEGPGQRLEEWTLNNAFISKVTFGDLSYDDDGLVEISCTFVYDFAEYKANA